MKCPFCSINKEKTRIIYKSKYSVVFFSNPRLMKGHLLVISKRHVNKLSELKKIELYDLIKTVIKFQEKIIKSIAPGCDIRQHYRPFIKDNHLKVSHLHFHLQPRWPNEKDDLYTKVQINEIKLFKSLEEKEVQEVTQKIK